MMKYRLLVLFSVLFCACSDLRSASTRPAVLAQCGADGGMAGAAGAQMGGGGAGGAAAGGGSGTAGMLPGPGEITGFGVNGQPRMWGTNGLAVKPALDLLVNDLGSNFFRVEIFRGQSTWEATNDNADPNTFNWTAYDAIFGTKDFTDLFNYIRYLNTLGVTEIILAAHGPLPAWMGGTSLNTSAEDEFVEGLVALLVYARTRAPDPKPVFTMVGPWNEPNPAQVAGGEGFIIAPTPQGLRVARKLVDRMNTLPELTGIGVEAGDEANAAATDSWRSTLSSDPVVLARLRGTGFHRYSAAQSAGPWTNETPPNWMTEFNSSWQGACYTTTWAMGLEAAENLRSALDDGATAGLVWAEYDAPHSHQADEWQSFGLLATTFQGSSNLCFTFDHEQPTDAALDSMTYAPKPTYQAVRHAFRFIRRGAVKVPVTAGGPLKAVAFRNPDQSTAVFGTNTGASGTYTVTLSSNPPAALTPRVSTSGNYDQVGSTVTLSNGSGQFTIPGASVFTLLSSGGMGGMGGAGGVAGAGGMSGGGAGGAGAGGMSGSGGSGGSGGAGTGGMGGAGAGGMSGGGAGGAGAGGMAGGAGAGGAAGQVQFRASSFAQSAQSNTITRPTAIQGGDRIFLGQAAYDSTTVTSNATSAGFVQHATVTRTTGNRIRLWVFSKSAAGTPGAQTTEPASYTITNNEGKYQDLLLFSVFGHDTATPVQTSTTATGASTAMSVPSISVARAGSLGLWWKIGYNNATSGNPSGFTMIVADQDSVNDAAYRAYNVGATGAVMSTQSGSDSWVNAFLMVQP